MSTGTTRHSVWRTAVAAMAAIGLMVQAVLISATAPMPVSPLVDTASALCTHPDTDTPADVPDGAPQHGRHDGCCVLCQSPGLDGAGAAPTWSRPAPVRTAAVIPRVFSSLPSPGERLPGEPRAPPPTA